MPCRDFLDTSFVFSQATGRRQKCRRSTLTDLVYRHALDIDEAGERLAFGSTTGSLWVSEDAGDSWQTLSSNLPPIHAVRFEKSV